MAHYLVTGGAGFIGSAIVRRILATEADATVRVLDNFSTGHRENLTELGARVEVVESDLRDPTMLAGAMREVDFVIHQAAQVSVPRSVADPLETDSVNTHGTLALLHAAQQAGVRRVVIASTCAVYGDNPNLPLHEESERRPLSPYAASKLATEGYASVFTHTYGLPVVALRYFNVYGPRQDPASPYAAAIPIFMSRLFAGTAPTIFGDGQQTRDFVFVDDVARANLRALADEVPAGTAYNIGSGERVSLLELLATLNALLGSTIEPSFAPPRQGDIVHSGGDIRKAHQQLGWRAERSLHDGLAHTLDWFRQREALRGGARGE